MAQLAANITRKPICVGPTAHQWRAFKLQWLLNKACNQNNWWAEDDPLNNSCNNEMIHTGKSTIANQQTRHAKSGFILQSQQAGSAKINFQWQKKGVTFHFENIWLTHTASHFPPNTGFEHSHHYGFDCNNKLRHSNNHPTWAFSLKSKKTSALGSLQLGLCLLWSYILLLEENSLSCEHWIFTFLGVYW